MNWGDIASLAVIVVLIAAGIWWMDGRDVRDAYADLRRGGASRWVAGSVAMGLLALCVLTVLWWSS